jgi:hypothetical protein
MNENMTESQERLLEIATNLFDKEKFPIAEQVTVPNEWFKDLEQKVSDYEVEFKRSISHIQRDWLRYCDAKRELMGVEREKQIDMESVCAQIRSLSTVRDCTHQFNTLFVMTRELIARDGEHAIVIGPTLITIPMSHGSNHDIKFVCLGELYEGYGGNLMGHPHAIDSDFSACLGSYSGILFERLRNFEYVEAIEVVLTFLQTFDSKDPAGAYYRSWPKANQTEPTDEPDKEGGVS